MESRVLDRQTLADVFVNLVPLAVLAYFAVLCTVVEVGGNRFFLWLGIGLLLVPFASLALVTYVSGRAISEAETDPE